MNCYQPFYVGIGNKRFKGISANGYLPALESKEIPREDKVEPQWVKRQWGMVQQLKAQVLFLSNKINEMRAKASKRKTYTIK